MLTDKEILHKAEKMRDAVTELRRELHRLAETGGKAVRTSEYIQKRLEELGIPYETSSNCILAHIETGVPGPCIGLRADMDALPLPENPENLKCKRTCISDTPDKTCHACGHDAHVAMLLATAEIIMRDINSFKGNFYLAFEDGEENGLGWPEMSKLLDGKKIDTFWGIHVWSELPSGEICVQAGPRMAGTVGVDVTFVGKGGHGSRPDQAVNPVFIAANYLDNLAVAWANRIDANETVTLGITSIQGGEVANVIPDRATVIGSCRFFSLEEGEKADGILKTVAEHTAGMHGASVEFGKNARILGGPLINTDFHSEIAEKELISLLGEKAVVRHEPWFAGDSFHWYLEAYSGVMAHLGIKNPDKGTGAAHHNSRFDVDEDVLTVGIASTLGYIKAVYENGIGG